MASFNLTRQINPSPFKNDKLRHFLHVLHALAASVISLEVYLALIPLLLTADDFQPGPFGRSLQVELGRVGRWMPRVP